MQDRKQENSQLAARRDDVKATAEHQLRRCDDSRKLPPPFWSELREEVLHPSRNREDETSKQARVRTLTENEKDNSRSVSALPLLTTFYFSLPC